MQKCINKNILWYHRWHGGSTVLYPFVPTLYTYDNRIWALKLPKCIKLIIMIIYHAKFYIYPFTSIFFPKT